MPANLRSKTVVSSSTKTSKTVVSSSTKTKRKRQTKIQVEMAVPVEENDETDADIITISHEQGNEEMLQLAAEAEARVPADERNTEWPIKVPGRLGLTGSSRGKPYAVIEAEMRRRICQPEQLSTSAICQYLKRRRTNLSVPKSLPAIKVKKRTSDSFFTLLTEGEAKDLAEDFGQITKQENFFGKLCQNIRDPLALRRVPISNI